jgi:hypothetical protein
MTTLAEKELKAPALPWPPLQSVVHALPEASVSKEQPLEESKLALATSTAIRETTDLNTVQTELILPVVQVLTPSAVPVPQDTCAQLELERSNAQMDITKISEDNRLVFKCQWDTRPQPLSLVLRAAKPHGLYWEELTDAILAQRELFALVGHPPTAQLDLIASKVLKLHAQPEISAMITDKLTTNLAHQDTNVTMQVLRQSFQDQHII